ncbi:SE1561 family protein [Sporolactobacillus shoreicorticis]|uniref:SE1561 family protein n=1 Tax=Sporolactobacillus shoreicorticis TaxID=1923877 RepID=A0ABW5S4N0_9BACL|nr:SE1561 family protein [Sporolactobacillus shoreicorticis]MCO7125800.1 SE1561 family protein [Sporolactobacillus shoreicorticis]
MLEMGRATNSKEDQVIYLKNRFKLLAQVVGALNEETAEHEDLENILAMMENLEVKIRRFRDDWAEGLVEK